MKRGAIHPPESAEPVALTEIGSFPESWGSARLGELFDVQQGKALSPAARRGLSPRPFLRTANVLWGRLDLRKVDEMDFTEEEAERLALRHGDLLVCEGGEIGRTAIWNGQLDGCLYQNHVHRLRSKSPDAVPSFVMYWMQAALLSLNLYGGIGNRTTIPNLSASRLRHLSVPIPPVIEQRAIAAVLATHQSALATQDKIVAGLKELKSATLAKLFREGLRGESLKQTEIGEIPESWAVSRFGDFATLQRGYDLPVHERRPGTIPVVGSNGIVGNHSNPAVKGPGVITGRSGTIGLSFFCEQDFWPLNTALFVSSFHGNDPSFAHYLFEVFDFRRYSAGVSVPTLNRNLVHQALLAVPPVSEQAKMAAILRRLDSTAGHAESRRNALKSLFSSMLHVLMTGQVRVPLDLIGRLGAPPGAAQGSSANGRQSRAAGQHGKPDEAMLQEIVRRIVAAVAPKEIILFGSAARGEMGPDSDIDLLVVKACEHRREVARAVRDCLRGVAPGRGKDVVVVTPEDVERDRDTIGYIIRPALREGRVLYAA